MHTSIDSYGSELHKNYKINSDDDDSSFKSENTLSSRSFNERRKNKELDYQKIAKKYAKMAKHGSMMTRQATFKRSDRVGNKGLSADRREELSQAVNDRLSLNINTTKNMIGKPPKFGESNRNSP